VGVADHITIQVRPSKVEAPAREARSRIARALVCPFCRDEVKRTDAVACARSACGALYHRACWRECAGHYGGCAIWGCGSSEVREVSTVGYLVFLLKLVLAAIFLPPSVARRVTEASTESLLGVAVRAFRSCRKVLPDRWTIGSAVAVLAIIPVLGGIGGAADLAREHDLRYALVPVILGGAVVGVLPVLAWVVLWIWLLPFLAVLGALVTRTLLHFVGVAFRGALPALARADGGLTVLDRLRRGPRQK
jgi:hypothetical protein